MKFEPVIAKEFGAIWLILFLLAAIISCLVASCTINSSRLSKVEIQMIRIQSQVSER